MSTQSTAYSARAGTIVALLICLLASVTNAQSANHDHEKFPRIPGFNIQFRTWNAGLWITNYKEALPRLDFRKCPQSSYLYIIEDDHGPSIRSNDIIAYYRSLVASLKGTKISEVTGVARGAPYYSAGILVNGKEYWIKVCEFRHIRNRKDSACARYEFFVIERNGNVTIEAKQISNQIQKSGRVTLDIRFESGSAIISGESLEQVEQLARAFRENSGLKASIEGHTDNVGSSTENKTLSVSRAEAVKAALVKRGIQTGRLTCLGWGADKPVADNNTDQGRSKNRRVEVVKKTR